SVKEISEDNKEFHIFVKGGKPNEKITWNIKGSGILNYKYEKFNSNGEASASGFSKLSLDQDFNAIDIECKMNEYVNISTKIKIKTLPEKIILIGNATRFLGFYFDEHFARLNKLFCPVSCGRADFIFSGFPTKMLGKKILVKSSNPKIGFTERHFILHRLSTAGEKYYDIENNVINFDPIGFRVNDYSIPNGLYDFTLKYNDQEIKFKIEKNVWIHD
ncbi:hypothetical protein L8W40_06490, partial [Campylobacter sp. IFREMER_LSEM_CL1846]|uniref:hypothetical protein n=1 Tax=Campylobacter sp. IFREMER_LSEM_CL1846 TaxID=2911614 RepID=UPI0021E667CA